MRTYQCAKTRLLITQKFCCSCRNHVSCWKDGEVTLLNTLLLLKNVSPVLCCVLWGGRTSYIATIIISCQLPCCQFYRCFFFHVLHLSCSWGSRHKWDLQGLLSRDDLQAAHLGDQWAGKMSHAGLVGKPLRNQGCEIWSGAAENSGLLWYDALFWVSSFWHI